MTDEQMEDMGFVPSLVVMPKRHIAMLADAPNQSGRTLVILDRPGAREIFVAREPLESLAVQLSSSSDFLTIKTWLHPNIANPHPNRGRPQIVPMAPGNTNA